MKLLTYGFALICIILAVIIKINGHQIYKERDTYNMFEDFLEKFKTVMKTGNETLGIPVLDPFAAERIPIEIDDDLIKLDGLLTNVKVDGLSAYDVNQGDFKLIGPKLIMNISWPMIAASTNYSIEGKADNFEIYGHGEMKISPRDFFLETEIGFTMNGKYLKVKDMKLKIFLRALDFHATGLFDDDELSELLSALISDMVPQLIQDYHDMITDKAILLVTEKLNAFLSTMTLAELLKLIGI